MHEDIKQKLKDLEQQLSDPAVINDPKKLQKVSKEHAEIKDLVEIINELEKISSQIVANKELINQGEKELSQMAEAELPGLEAKETELKNKLDAELNPADPNDKKNAIMEIRAGTGGDESALFAADLFRMYSHYAESHGWRIEVLNSNHTGIGGYKEIILQIKGKGAYGAFKYEAGTHRVQRVPETEKQGRIHTSAATVAVFPEAEEVDLEINPVDLRIDTFCSSGPGGQSVNTTYSAIRITHEPTGLVVSCQDQKSQHQNKEKAMQVLRSRLLKRAEDERRSHESSQRKAMIGSGDRSEKIRTYNFPQDRVTDHRIGQSWHGIERIISGEIEPIISSLKDAEKNQNRTE